MSTPDLSQDVIEEVIADYGRALLLPLTYMLMMCAFGATLVPCLVALFYFATPKTRRTPIFISVVLSTFLGIVYSIFTTYTLVQSVSAPYDLAYIKRIYMPRALLSALAPFTIDITLFIRMLVVYPPSLMPVPTSVLLFSPPIILKIIRVISWVLWTQSTPEGATTVVEYTSVTTGEQRWSVIGDVMRVSDEAYVSVAFLWKLRQGIKNGSEAGGISSGSDRSFGARLRTLFWIATTNFTIPLPFSIAALITKCIVSAVSTADFASLIREYVSIICVILASIWSSSLSRHDNVIKETEYEHSRLGTLRFRVPIETAELSHAISVEFPSRQAGKRDLERS